MIRRNKSEIEINKQLYKEISKKSENIKIELYLKIRFLINYGDYISLENINQLEKEYSDRKTIRSIKKPKKKKSPKDYTFFNNLENAAHEVFKNSNKKVIFIKEIIGYYNNIRGIVITEKSLKRQILRKSKNGVMKDILKENNYFYLIKVQYIKNLLT